MRGDNTDVYRQINNNEFLYVNSFNPVSSLQFYFRKFKKEKLVSNYSQQNKMESEDSTHMYDYTKRTVVQWR
jgi:lipopolysaccharide export system permease protein